MLDHGKLIAWREPEIVHRYRARDTILYGLSLGYGQDPVDPRQLRFVHEGGLQALPSMATVLASPWGWLYRAGAGVTQARAVHGHQGVVLHRPLPPEGEVVGGLRVTGIDDKGPGRGAVVAFERELRDAGSGALLCTVTATMFCRGDGGPQRLRLGEIPPEPAGTGGQKPGGDAAGWVPDAVREYDLLPQAALLFRLHGDTNPLHADPPHAARAGFERPILHGLCSYGMATRAVLSAYCEDEPAQLAGLSLRFAAPVFPGERLRIEMRRGEAGIAFVASVPARRAQVLSHGLAWLRAAPQGGE